MYFMIFIYLNYNIQYL